MAAACRGRSGYPRATGVLLVRTVRGEGAFVFMCQGFLASKQKLAPGILHGHHAPDPSHQTAGPLWLMGDEVLCVVRIPRVGSWLAAGTGAPAQVLVSASCFLMAATCPVVFSWRAGQSKYSNFQILGLMT
jgi:hypothetical protein